MRIADPDGAWMPHPDDARLLVPVPPAGAAAGHRPLPRCSTRARSSTTTASRSRRPARPRGSTSTATSRPAGARSVRGVRRPPAVGAGDRRPRAGHRRPPQRVRLQRLPHQRRRAAAPVVDAARLGAAAARRVDVEAARRDRHAPSPATRCTRCTRTSRGTSPTTMSGAADDWAYEHLGVFSWTTEFWDVVERRHRHASSRPTSGTLGPTDEQALAVLRWVDEHAPEASSSTGTRSSTPSSAPSSSAAGRTSGIWTNPPATGCGRRSRHTPRSPSPRRWPSPCLEIRHQRPSTSAAAPGGSRSASPTPAGCRRTSRRGRPTHDLVRPIVAEVGGDGVDRRRRPGPPAARPARRPRRDALHARPRRHARPPAGDVGRPGRGRRRGHRHRPPRPRRRQRAPRSSLRRQYLTFAAINFRRE